MGSKWDFSSRGRARVVAITVLGTFTTLVISLCCVDYTTQFMDAQARVLTFGLAWALPLLMSAPFFYYFAGKLRDGAIAQHQLALIASRDSLTTCLNRGAFITLVDAYLSQVNAPVAVEGGLLMVDADKFKSINDRFGHPAGDRALQLMAEAIKSSVRAKDLVGRVGGEEFAVFLPQANAVQVRDVAERIRTRVNTIGFAPNGRSCPLSVSVGGVVFRSSIRFEQLFAAADARLYEAKGAGRNRVDVTSLPLAA